MLREISAPGARAASSPSSKDSTRGSELRGSKIMSGAKLRKHTYCGLPSLQATPAGLLVSWGLRNGFSILPFLHDSQLAKGQLHEHQVRIT